LRLEKNTTMQVNRIEHPPTNMHQCHITGDTIENFHLEKQSLTEEWVCILKSGRIKIQLDFKEYDICVKDGESHIFIIHDNVTMRVVKGSSDMEMCILVIGSDCLATLYPFLGSDATSQLYSSPMISSADFSSDMVEMLEAGCMQLWCIISNPQLLQRDKIGLHLLVHIYLLFYSGIGQKKTAKNSVQSFNIINRFDKLFSDPESFKHRSAKYFADKLNISPRYFFEVCKNESGHSPKELLDEAITSEIRLRILTTELSFQQISIAFDFPDQTAFAQYFKRNVGMTPSEFRKKYK